MRVKRYAASLAAVALVALGLGPADAFAAQPEPGSQAGVAPYRLEASFDSPGAARASSVHAASGAQPQELACAGTPDGQWQLDRFHGCWHAGLTYTARDIRTGVPVGWAHVTITQDFQLANNRTTWTETDTLRMDSAGGVVAGGLSATWTAGCSSNCQATQPAPFAPNTWMAPGQTLTGTTEFSDPQARGGIDHFAPGYTLEMLSPGSLGDAPAVWATPQLRCDFQLSRRAGCVVPEVTPTFQVDSGANPIAAYGIRWAQENLATHPGLAGSGEPLHRLADDAQQRSNRNTVCGRGWSPDLLTVPTDSCDEFPFAASREGGSMPGPECAELKPHVNLLSLPWEVRTGPDGQPIADVVQAPAPNTTCARVHVPLTQNTYVGGALGRFASAQRLVDNDPYWVSAA